MEEGLEGFTLLGGKVPSVGLLKKAIQIQHLLEGCLKSNYFQRHVHFLRQRVMDLLHLQTPF